MNSYYLIRKLAKQNRFQNLFSSVKDFGFHIFQNDRDLTQIQNFFINYLFFYDSINKDLMIKKISAHVLDKELYEDAYMLYKREKGNTTDTEEKSHKDVKLVIGNEVNFPDEDK